MNFSGPFILRPVGTALLALGLFLVGAVAYGFLPVSSMPTVEFPTIRVSASRPEKGDDIVLHFVNYNREEPKEKRGAGSGVVDEKPLGAEGVEADFVVPEGFHTGKVEFMTPESPDPVALATVTKNGRLHFKVPKFLVYALARVELKR